MEVDVISSDTQELATIAYLYGEVIVLLDCTINCQRERSGSIVVVVSRRNALMIDQVGAVIRKGKLATAPGQRPLDSAYNVSQST